MQVVIYDLDGVSVYSDLAAADRKIKELYGQKLGAEACARLVKGRAGTIYRRHGGPRVELVSDADAARIRRREIDLEGCLKNLESPQV